jgi:hypothetical protein
LAGNAETPIVDILVQYIKAQPNVKVHRHIMIKIDYKYIFEVGALWSIELIELSVDEFSNKHNNNDRFDPGSYSFQQSITSEKC